jgi:ADP-ribose pyrophosphatase YjhB (NUDIX family)
MNKSIETLEAAIGDASAGLPEDVFLFISRITPMINVDLLLKNERQQTLLTWRQDGLCVPGWHVPGGIVRFKETLAHRIHAVAASELGATIEVTAQPLAINEVIHPARKVRGHFISLLYECRLTSTPDAERMYAGGHPQPGVWAWHDRCPDNIIAVHEMYRRFM